MSILTKICVVILVFAVLVASGVFVTLTTAMPNYRALFEQEKLGREQNAMHYRTAVLANQQLRGERDAAVDRSSQLAREKDDAQRTALGEIESLRADKVALTRGVEGIRADLAKLEQTLKTEQDARVKLQGDLKSEMDENVTLQERNRELIDALRDKDVALQRLELIAKNLRQTLSDQERRIQDLETQLASGSRVAPGAGAEVIAATAAEDIRGTVTAVDENVASINIGTANGVRKGMKMTVYRGGEFVSFLQVAEVDVNASYGVIVDKRMGMEPQQGDKVKVEAR